MLVPARLPVLDDDEIKPFLNGLTSQLGVKQRFIFGFNPKNVCFVFQCCTIREVLCSEVPILRPKTMLIYYVMSCFIEFSVLFVERLYWEFTICT